MVSDVVGGVVGDGVGRRGGRWKVVMLLLLLVVNVVVEGVGESGLVFFDAGDGSSGGDDRGVGVGLVGVGNSGGEVLALLGVVVGVVGAVVVVVESSARAEAKAASIASFTAKRSL